ncbi:MAG: ABC transporter ATP-binding protein [Rhizobiales bacterium 65-79]|jgi:simple sugar transport system ATP-binding protein|nr:sugar ABC transporter ATP-binding protein [Hyphomicrobiales bacterium]OJU00305.1 MAG: ABC transporter ATP-binding protein [Rhizobiales bacterium 65-79]
MSDAEPLLVLRNIRKSFGRIEVLKGIDLTIGKGEIVALVGDNGAGKSTLIKVITGVHKPSAGEIVFKGEPITLKNVQASRLLGIETVYQERALADQQELWRNIFAGRELTRFLGFLDVKAQKRETGRLMRSGMGLTSRAITVDSEVKGLSGGEKQSVAIGRALYFDADLIILDEPTMGLSLKETERVLAFVRSIREQGKSAIFIDHNIFHVHDTADRFVILDRGRVVGQFHRSELTHQQLVDMMIELHEAGQVAR